jgi:hypothetical protein
MPKQPKQESVPYFVRGAKTVKQSAAEGKGFGTVCESPVIIPEYWELFDVVSAWASLPSNIRMAIVLLVQQHVQ